MTNKELMLAGEFYFVDEELAGEQTHCKKLIEQFNRSSYDCYEERELIIRQLFGKVGKKCNVNQPLHVDYGTNISVGDNFFANYNLTILDVNTVTIGNNVLIAPNVSIFSATHPVDALLRRHKEYGLPVVIGDDVWIGGNVVINPGVTIGSNVVIGSGSVVTKNIPSNCVAVGNPCHILKTLPKMPE